MKKSILSKRETSAIKDIIRKSWPPNAYNSEDEKNLISYDIGKGHRLLCAKAFTAAQIDSWTIVPFLGTVQTLTFFPFVVVDMGAIKFVCNGAKIMRPGITAHDDFTKGEYVTVKDEKFLKVLAIGRALEDSAVAFRNSKGYVVDNLHYVGDEFWETYKEINLKS
jgi:malignant T-cell-amplified sequence